MNKDGVSSNVNLVSKYWNKKTFGREDLSHQDSDADFLAVVNFDFKELTYFHKITGNNALAGFTVVSSVYCFLLKRLTSDFDGCIVSGYGSDYASLLFLFPTDLKTSFKDYLQYCRHEVLESLEYGDLSGSVFADGFDHLSHYRINFNSRDASSRGITLNVMLSSGGDLEFEFYYSDHFVNKGLVERLADCMREFILNLEGNVQGILSAFPVLSQQERQQVLYHFNDTGLSYPTDATIVSLFEEQAARMPDNIALIFENTRLTYRELNGKANQLARYISQNCAIGTGDIVGVLLPKSSNGVISLLAILKLGGVYLPIDPHYPGERIDYLIQDSGLKFLISSTSGSHPFVSREVQVLFLENADLDSQDIANLSKTIDAHDLAYVIYTSGSTGKPKGVMIEHTSNINMSLDQIRSFEITPQDRIVWFASVSFDASISEIMMSLYSGAALCIPDEHTIKDKDKFTAFLKESQSTVVTLPPSYLGLMTGDDLSGLRCIITAGEPANAAHALAITGTGISYYNAYGPTECAVCVSIYKVTEKDSGKSAISIGCPIANTQIYILDDALEPLPVGVAGKLYVGGAGVGRGYLHKEVLTREKFISNPFNEDSLLYDTGDLGCWHSDGTIDFLGRKDHQVKIRGYRIELGEIENTILQYRQDIRQLAVEVRENNQQKVLVAYLVSKSGIDKSHLRDFLLARLPDYMVPAFYVLLDKLPLTPNGKIDRKALGGITQGDLIKKEYVPAATALEADLTVIWEEILGVEKIGTTDNFFELGGHSLSVSQVINAINKSLGRTVSFKNFFASPTISGISAQLEESSYKGIAQCAVSDSYPLTASQNRLWLLSQLEGGSLAYNMPAAVKLEGPIDAALFEESFRLLIDRHEILRTSFKIDAQGEVRQYIAASGESSFSMEQKDFLGTENQQEKILNYLQQKNRTAFDLEQGPLMRISLVRCEENQHIFFLSLHHIIGDGWSIEILISEIIQIYNSLKAGKPVSLPELGIQYKDYAVWQNRELQNQKHTISAQYWLKKFSGELPVLNLPGFKSRPLVQTYNGDTIRHTFNEEFLNKLKKFSQEWDVTLFMVLTTAINALLSRYTGQQDIIIGTPVAGREHPDLENQIGLYLNTLAIRSTLEQGSSFLDVLKSQKETLLEGYDHQNYPFDALVGSLNLKRDTSRSALFDVLVVLQNQSQLNRFKSEELSELRVSDYGFKSQSSQLDMSFTFVETSVLNLSIEYNTDIYDEYLAERIFGHFENLLTAFMQDPHQAIQQADYLSMAEKDQLLNGFNNTELVYSKEKTIIDLFEHQAGKTPNNIAVVFENTELSYKELNEKANQLAHYL
ncbi:non-ribosomal peptide synthetase, partial [[Flexibacter] sp. ATCC 35103]|uniref:non-ribosomal peptide synthetase n=1 Tax=[Flexibacter] sp. ATCC 35103 TaxID=1937528 RepID=UPI000F4F7657